MNPARIIARKRDGHALSREEIAAFLGGYVDDSIPDHQMAALAMAICLNGMNAAETAALTEVMLRSGSTLPRPPQGLSRVDKHSTGGIGDKTSLVLVPLLACCDLEVPMISGRGLGPTGGTLDKLESIPGFRTDLNGAEIAGICERVGCVITGTTDDLVPADRRLYALRDVTGTVPSIPLITASIMSKKLAESLDALVLDVKFGCGAFMKTLGDARALAEAMVAVGSRMGLETTALLTDMNQPLGRMIGNAVEVDEAIDVLNGRGPEDVRELVLALAAELLLVTGRADDLDDARNQAMQTLDAGAALEKFREMVAAQGGDPDRARVRASAYEVTSTDGGFVARIDAEALGQTVVELGGGRVEQGDMIDHAVGIEVLVRLGDEVAPGAPLARLFGGSSAVEEFSTRIARAFELEEDSSEHGPLIATRITGDPTGP